MAQANWRIAMSNQNRQASRLTVHSLSCLDRQTDKQAPYVNAPQLTHKQTDKSAGASELVRLDSRLKRALKCNQLSFVPARSRGDRAAEGATTLESESSNGASRSKKRTKLSEAIPIAIAVEAAAAANASLSRSRNAHRSQWNKIKWERVAAAITNGYPKCHHSASSNTVAVHTEPVCMDLAV